MTHDLTRGMELYRRADDEPAMVEALECLESALRQRDEQVRRETILACSKVARGLQSGDVADHIMDLMSEGT